MADQEKILDLVRKLLAQAEGTTFKAEAESFYAKAQELMAKYAIDQAMLKPQQRSTAIVENRMRVPGKQATVKAKRELLQSVVFYNRCRLFATGDPETYLVVGFSQDVEYVEFLFTSLLTHMTADMERELRRQGTSRHASVFRNNFAHGYAWEVARRFRAADLEMQKNLPNPQALVLYKGEVDDWIKANYVLGKGKRRSQGRQRQFDSTARAAGTASGMTADLSAGRRALHG